MSEEGSPRTPPGFGSLPGTSNILTHILHPTDRQLDAIEAYLREYLRRMGLQNVQARLTYEDDSEEMDEEIQMETPPVTPQARRGSRVQFTPAAGSVPGCTHNSAAQPNAQPRAPAEGQQTQNLPPLAAAQVWGTGQAYNPYYGGYGYVYPPSNQQPIPQFQFQPHIPQGSNQTYQTLVPQPTVSAPQNIPQLSMPQVPQHTQVFYQPPPSSVARMPELLQGHDLIVPTEPGPFVQWIEDYPLPNGVELPAGMEMYDGKGDPDNHLRQFNGVIRIQKWTVPVACHMFTMTLRDTARVWLEGLPAGSVTGFDDLKTKFRSHFSQQKKCKKMHIEAHNVKRRDGESVRQFITRYTDETAMIKGLNEDQRVSGFIHGLRHRPLVEFLSTDLPASYTAALDRTYIFLTARETAGDVGKTEPTDERKSQGKEYDRRGRNNRSDRNRYSPYSKTSNSTGTNHGTLNSTMHKSKDILAAEKLPGGSGKRPFDKNKGKDMAKFCEFHNLYGHETNECRIFKGQVEEAIRTGKLSQLMKGIKSQKTRSDQGKAVPIEEQGVKPEPMEEPILMIRTSREVYRREEPTAHEWWQTEISFPPIREEEASDSPLVVSAVIGNHPVGRIHLDTGSGCEIMYEQCFLRLRPSLRKLRRDSHAPLIGFSGERSWPLGEITLNVTVGDPPRTRTETMTFTIVRASSPYNAILGRTAMRRMGIIPSPVHSMAKFPTPYGIGRLISNPPRVLHRVDVATPAEAEPEEISGIAEQEERVSINPNYPDQCVTIGALLPTAVKRKLVEILRKNIDVFAWTPADMTGVPRHLRFGNDIFDTQHRLNVRPHVEPVKQKRRSLAADRNRAAGEQVSDLVKAGILREVKYHSWVANPVMVKKSDGGWRMCVDFTDINKACPKDCYPLPEIDWKVESLGGFRLKCFLDAYKGYHQIQMLEGDEEKTAFYTGEGIYCYKKMPFGLKNAGATYQRLIDKAFGSQIGRNLEAYVDDMVIKSRTEEDMFLDIEETFRTLRSINMKLNPKKCSFGVEEGRFLGHLITRKGIRPDPDKVNDIRNMKSPRTLKEVQALNGRLAALHRFLSKSADRSLPFFKTLKGCLDKKSFVWTREAEEAFTELKDYLAKLPTITAPVGGETLQMYLAASEETASAALVANRKEGQVPVYFVSRVLQGPEMRYPDIKKLALALIHAARRLRRYFQAHPIQVLTDRPIKQVLTRPEVSGRLAKWAIELGEHEIEFRPRTSIKGQALADFLAEAPVGSRGKRKQPEKVLNLYSEEAPSGTVWRLFTDGASSADASGAGLILINPEGQEFTYALRFNFKASNNASEYEALLAGLRIAKEMGVQEVHAFVDSQVVAFQVNGTYEAKEPNMKKYLDKVKEIKQHFKVLRIENISRSKNKIADALSKLASTSFAHLTKKVLVETLDKSSIEEDLPVSAIEEEGPTWMTPIVEYLTSGILPEDKDQARKVRVKAPQYVLRDEGLYRRSYLGPLLRCVGPKQAREVIREVHEGSCGLHAAPRTVVAKVTTMGYFWPSMHQDTKEELQSCNSCQIHSSVAKAPKNDLIPVTSAWPFLKWGIDIVGPFPEAPGKLKFLVVAIDYFTKWVEAKPLATISGKHMEKFVWEHVVTRFGIPRVIVSDNGKQFAEGAFRNFCDNLEIQQSFTSVAHPQANGQVEVTNRDLVKGIKTRLGRSQHAWVDELHQVLWAHRTTPKTSNGETPFSLVYGSEAMIPAEVSVPTIRRSVTEAGNEVELRQNLELLEERREIAAIREASYKKQMQRYYNKRVRKETFSPGDHVFRNNEASKAENQGKLGPQWEGPYVVTESCGNGAYKLETPEGKPLPRTWNAMQLRRCYV